MSGTGVVGKRQASTKENNNGIHHVAGGGHSTFDHMKFSGKSSTSTGPTVKASHKSQTLSNRNLSFHGTNSTARVVNQPAVINGSQASGVREGLCGTITMNAQHHGHMHQKSLGNIESLSKQHKSQHSSSSLGKAVRLGKHKMSGQNSAIYNSNNQKMVESQLSTRNNNAPGPSQHFALHQHDHTTSSGQAPLRDL